ncbi:MAG: mechanosensitive ion channel [Holophagae bacterium]|jgi:small conductance mechanosensitive channel
MKNLTTRRLVLVAACVLLTATGTSSFAQGGETTSPTDNKLATQAQELLQSIATEREVYERLKDEILSAVGDDRRAFEKRANDVAFDLVEDVHALAANVVAREAKGLGASADRAVVTDLVLQISAVLESAVRQRGEEITELGKRREAAVPDEVPDLEQQMEVADGRIDRALEILVSQVDVQESLGLDAQGERDFLAGYLPKRASLLAGRIELARDQLTAVDARFKAEPQNADLKLEHAKARQTLEAHVEKLDSTANQMEVMGLDASAYRQLRFEATGEITKDLMSREVMSRVLASWKDSSIEWLSNNGPKLIFKAIVFVLILAAFWVLARVAKAVVRKAIRSSRFDWSQLLERTALSVTGTLVMVFGLLMALSQFGVEVAPLLAGLGVAGFIVGFALQDTLANFASGVMILIYRPYDVGDLVDVAGGFGKVSDMNLVSTTLLTVDHQTLVIPNSKIWGDVIKNVTAQDIRRVDLVFGISYSDDIPKAEKVLAEIVAAHEMVLENPEPVIKLHNLGDSSVDFIVRPWAKTDDYWDVHWDLTREVKLRFDAEGISIPFPQRDIHIVSGGPNGEG